jgi:hypothetical protein
VGPRALGGFEAEPAAFEFLTVAFGKFHRPRRIDRRLVEHRLERQSDRIGPDERDKAKRQHHPSHATKTHNSSSFSDLRPTAIFRERPARPAHFNTTMSGDPLQTGDTDPQLPGPLRAELSRVYASTPALRRRWIRRF